MDRLVILGQGKKMDWLYWGREYKLTGDTGTLVNIGTQRMNVLVLPEQRV